LDPKSPEVLLLSAATPEGSREHSKLHVEADPDLSNYFANLAPGEPGVFHSTKEMIFIRLDIARFTGFPEVIQPRVLAELNELVHAELENPRVWGDSKPKKPARVLHTGDGFILAYEMPSGDLRPWPLEIAQRLAHVLDCSNDTRVPINFRIIARADARNRTS
jgi:hypothetical protein